MKQVYLDMLLEGLSSAMVAAQMLDDDELVQDLMVKCADAIAKGAKA